jgi:hypothetical protein
MGSPPLFIVCSQSGQITGKGRFYGNYSTPTVGTGIHTGVQEYLEAHKAVIDLNKSFVFHGRPIILPSRDKEELRNAHIKLDNTRKRLSCINQKLVEWKEKNQVESYQSTERSGS